MNFRKLGLAAATAAALVPAISPTLRPRNPPSTLRTRLRVEPRGLADGAAPTYKVDYRGIQYVESVADILSARLHLSTASPRAARPECPSREQPARLTSTARRRLSALPQDPRTWRSRPRITSLMEPAALRLQRRRLASLPRRRINSR